MDPAEARRVAGVMQGASALFLRYADEMEDGRVEEAGATILQAGAALLAFSAAMFKAQSPDAKERAKEITDALFSADPEEESLTFTDGALTPEEIERMAREEA